MAVGDSGGTAAAIGVGDGGWRSFLWNPVESRGIKFGRDTSQNNILGTNIPLE